MATDDVEPPLTVFVDSTHLLDVLDCHVRIGFIGTQDEIRLVGLRIAPFREAEVAILVVMFEAVCFERDRRTRMLAVMFAVAGRVRSLVSVVAVAVPAGERLSEFFEDSLTGLCVEVRIAFVALEVVLDRKSVV